MRRALVIVTVLGVLGAATWEFLRSRGIGPAARAEYLTVRWRGRVGGSMALPATLSWCPVTRVGVLEAISGDSGVTILLYERDSLIGGAHPVVAPDFAANTARPAATAALRWLHVASDTTLYGFRAASGTVQLRLSAGKASGELDSQMRSVNSTDSVLVHGTFVNVPVVVTAKGCT